jgi:hypothetical protein
VTFLRRAFLAAILLASVSRVARAQSVVVRHAPDVPTIELFLNQKLVASAPATDDNVRLTTKMAAEINKGLAEIDIVVDRCVSRVRIGLTERGAAPMAPDASCTRQQVPGIYVLRPVTTFVFDLSNQTATLLIAQGNPPRAWLRDEVPASLRPVVTPPLGFMAFGGIGLGLFSNMHEQACGDAPLCSIGQARLTLTGGLSWWLTKNIAAEASYVRPNEVMATGSGSSYNFTTTFDSEYLALVANVGGNVGRARIYAKGGMDYHRATFITSQVVEDRTIDLADGTTQFLPGGTQNYALQTAGWGVAFGGGFEVWLSKYIAVYGDGLNMRVTGPSRDGADGEADDRLTTIIGGVRIRLGR